MRRRTPRLVASAALGLLLSAPVATAIADVYAGAFGWPYGWERPLLATVPGGLVAAVAVLAFARLPEEHRAREVPWVRKAGIVGIGLHVLAFVVVLAVDDRWWGQPLVVFGPPIVWAWTAGFAYAFLPDDVRGRARIALVAAALPLLLPPILFALYLYALSQMGPV